MAPPLAVAWPQDSICEKQLLLSSSFRFGVRWRPIAETERSVSGLNSGGIRASSRLTGRDGRPVS